MRRPTPALIVTSVVLALAALPVAAQTARPGTSTATAGTGTTAPRVAAGGCRGSNGSSCTATTSTGANGTTGTGTTAAAETVPGNNITSSNNATGTTNNATGTTTNNATGTTTNNATGTTNNATGTFNNATGPSNATAADFNNNQTGPLSGLVRDNGTTVGTTGNASPNGNNTGTNTGVDNGTGAIGNSLFVPGLAGTLGTDAGAMADAGSGVNANGERVSGGGGNAANNGGGAAPNTLTTGNSVYAFPLYDATTKAATARDLRRRAARQEPRVIGLAPRTNADLTYQMPDDRIIRY